MPNKCMTGAGAGGSGCAGLILMEPFDCRFELSWSFYTCRVAVSSYDLIFFNNPPAKHQSAGN